MNGTGEARDATRRGITFKNSLADSFIKGAVDLFELGYGHFAVLLRYRAPDLFDQCLYFRFDLLVSGFPLQALTMSFDC